MTISRGLMTGLAAIVTVATIAGIGLYNSNLNQKPDSRSDSDSRIRETVNVVEEGHYNQDNIEATLFANYYDNGTSARWIRGVLTIPEGQEFIMPTFLDTYSSSASQYTNTDIEGYRVSSRRERKITFEAGNTGFYLATLSTLPLWQYPDYPITRISLTEESGESDVTLDCLNTIRRDSLGDGVVMVMYDRKDESKDWSMTEKIGCFTYYTNTDNEQGYYIYNGDEQRGMRSFCGKGTPNTIIPTNVETMINHIIFEEYAPESSNSNTYRALMADFENKRSICTTLRGKLQVLFGYDVVAPLASEGH